MNSKVNLIAFLLTHQHISITCPAIAGLAHFFILLLPDLQVLLPFSNSGIGYVMQRSIGTFDLPTMFAALVILALLGVILFWVVDRIEKLVIPWHVSQREEVIFTS